MECCFRQNSFFLSTEFEKFVSEYNFNLKVPHKVIHFTKVTSKRPHSIFINHHQVSIVPRLIHGQIYVTLVHKICNFFHSWACFFRSFSNEPSPLTPLTRSTTGNKPPRGQHQKITAERRRRHPKTTTTKDDVDDIMRVTY